jgi:hypothetical protein
MAQAVKAAVTSFPERHQQFHLLYFNNLDAPLPDTLAQSLRALFAALDPPPTYYLQTLPWLFNPGLGAAPSVGWWQMTGWSTFDDDSLAQTLTQYAGSALPYETQLHDSNVPVPLLSPEDTAAHAGQLIKICTSSPTVFASSSSPELHPIADPSWPIAVDDPPSYLVNLPNQMDVQQSSFVESTAVVIYQICTRYCADHPYLTDSGMGVTSWQTSPLCASKDY